MAGAVQHPHVSFSMPVGQGHVWQAVLQLVQSPETPTALLPPALREVLLVAQLPLP